MPFAVRHLLKWQAGNKRPFATGERQCRCWVGRTIEQRWPGLLGTCQLVSTPHRRGRAQRRGGGEDEREGEWERDDTCMCLSSLLNGGHVYFMWGLKMWKQNRDGENINVQVCAQREGDSDEDRGGFIVANGITGSWRVRWSCRCVMEVAAGEMWAHRSRTLRYFYLYCCEINQFRPHMKHRLFVLCYLLLLGNNH